MRHAIAIGVIVCTILGITWWLRAIFAPNWTCPEISVSASSAVVHVPEHYQWRFNAGSGDVVNVIMEPVGDPQQRCDDSGGTLRLSRAGIYLCQGVDF